MIVLSAADVHALLTPAVCRDLMREALVALADGHVFLPLRTVVRPPALDGLIALMTTHLHGPRPAFGMKSVCVFPGNPRAGKDAHQGVVTLFDPDSGEPLAVINASAVTEIRTAAVSALATDLLARPEARILTIFGTGVQARSHLHALRPLRPFTEIRIVGRTPTSADHFAAAEGSSSSSESSATASAVFESSATASAAAECSAAASAASRDADAGVSDAAAGRPVVRAFTDPAAAARGADVIVTATTSADPVLFAEWVSPGTHVNAVGSSIPTAAEIDPHLLAAATLVADRRESLLNESGDYRRAAETGLIGPGHVHGELGEILTGRVPGRTRPDEITVFKSLGLAVEDVVVARHLYEQALTTGRGSHVTF
ncbi:ornithine cyclodeaminase family protein [Actinoplanes flavus]|uniref:Ornithine cyclodeaminase family protein n=1 Tax=Actinoplanes flavus TaxID=2820290 RepID=A0ABS3UGQ9_9ACTN|nr:ornithine cyclodeaminase family protein [Actinoplanes flavus]MBO3737974.1 ornithine cyclodeaminase family protein [Actinoplanes flavus]